MGKSEGLLAHLKKFPSLISIYPMTEEEQALFIKDLGLWKVDHKKAVWGVVAEIQKLRNHYGLLGKIEGDLAIEALNEVLALLGAEEKQK